MIHPSPDFFRCGTAAREQWKTPPEVGLDLLVPLRERHLVDRPHDSDARVVHQHVETAEPLDRSGHQCGACCGVAHVARDAHRAARAGAAEPLRDLVHPGGGARAHHDAHPELDHAPGDRETDAARAPGDERDLSLEAHARLAPRSADVDPSPP
jgi:hypothetical protein